jgi:hypothetical protein
MPGGAAIQLPLAAGCIGRAFTDLAREALHSLCCLLMERDKMHNSWVLRAGKIKLWGIFGEVILNICSRIRADLDVLNFIWTRF